MGREASPDSLQPDQALEAGCCVAVCTCRRIQELSRFLDSLAQQTRLADELLIIDASPDDQTEQMLRGREGLPHLAQRVLYLRVGAARRGLTRQRNVALQWATRDLIVFFDDDIVLLPRCLEEMEAAHRSGQGSVTGVAAFLENQQGPPSLLWRVRRLLGIVPSLRPGSYAPGGMPVSWNFLLENSELTEGEWLCGCAMMWSTAVARRVRFTEEFSGYSNGEDVDFSRRMSTHGRLVVAGRAKALHLHASCGRPDPFGMGYWTLRNLHSVHRRCVANRGWWDAARFCYSFGMDTLVRAAWLIRPGDNLERLKFVCGRLTFFLELSGLKHRTTTEAEAEADSPAAAAKFASSPPPSC